MKFINITKEQKENLCDELARLAFEFRKDKTIKCIYFAPYKGLGSITGNVLEITLVRDNCKNDDLEEKLEEYSSKHQENDYIQKFGFKIIIDIDDAEKYTIMDLNPSECKRSNILMNSVILYDGTGEFTLIKEQTSNFVKNNAENVSDAYYYYDNVAEIFPPLDETLNNKCLTYGQIPKCS